MKYALPIILACFLAYAPILHAQTEAEPPAPVPIEHSLEAGAGQPKTLKDLLLQDTQAGEIANERAMAAAAAQQGAIPTPAASDELPPGMILPVGENALNDMVKGAAEEGDAEAIMRDKAFGAAINGVMPLRPEEIRRFLEIYDETKQASTAPVYEAPKPEIAFMRISLDPGQAPLTVKLAPGNVTTVNIVDVSGQPWPIQDVSWAGNFEVLQPEAGGHVLRITPLADFSQGNISLRLLKLNTPIILSLNTGRDVVHYRLDLQVPEYGPKANAPLIQQAAITISAGDKTLTQVLEGVPPESATKLKVEGIDGRSSAYKIDEMTYVRTPYTLLSPAWFASVKSADGMNVYALEKAPVLLLSDKGTMVRAYLREEVEITQ